MGKKEKHVFFFFLSLLDSTDTHDLTGGPDVVVKAGQAYSASSACAWQLPNKMNSKPPRRTQKKKKEREGGREEGETN